MALVAYDSSEFSDSEGEDAPSSSEAKPAVSLITDPPVTISKVEQHLELLINDEINTLPVTKKALFASLPTPRSSVLNVLPEEEDEFLNVGTLASQKANPATATKSKTSKPVKISIPALSQLGDVEEPTVKKPIQSGKGLLSVLPPPKQEAVKITNRVLIPHSLGKRKAEEQKLPPPKAAAVSLSKPKNRATFGNDDSDDDDENHDGSVDFFSLESIGRTDYQDVTVENSEKVIPAPTEQNFSSNSLDYCDVPLKFRDNWAGASTVAPVHSTEHTCATAPEEPSTSGSVRLGETTVNNQPQSEGSLSSLFADEGFMRLHGKKKRGKEEDIQIIDVSQDDQLPKTEEWLTKILTQESEYRPSRKKGFMPTAQQRRKHQITYLAFQAKERELELKNQWSQNRFTKRQTQSKYGF